MKIILILIVLLIAAPVNADTVLGIRSAEIANWASRAANGPYKSPGDASTNSPGDWERIVANKDAFAFQPSNGRWSPPQTQDGCVLAEPATFDWPEPSFGSTNWSHRLRDAAFHDMVMGLTTNHAAIRAELLWVSSQSFTQFGNATGIWCFDKMADSAPSWVITAILTRLLFAYDYMGRTSFTQNELDQLDRWFFDAADFWRRDMDQAVNEIFADRWNGNYARVEACDGPIAPFVGGTEIYSYAKFYNNLRGSILRFSSLAGVYLTNAGRNFTDGRAGTLAQILESGKMFVREYIRFSLFPQGFVGDFERVTDGTDVGWQYSGAAIGEVVAIADTFARSGDTSLFEYNTALGECGTEATIADGGSRNGQNRDLLFAVQSYMKYPTDVYARYANFIDSPADNNRIDGRLISRTNLDTQGVHETHLARANLYFRDTFIKQAYTRTHVNSVPYPVDPIGGPPPWQGENSIYPGILFMFGQIEDNAANPYGASPPTRRLADPCCALGLP